MRNAQDAALVTSPGWQVTAARAIAAGLTAFGWEHHLPPEDRLLACQGRGVPAWPGRS